MGFWGKSLLESDQGLDIICDGHFKPDKEGIVYIDNVVFNDMKNFINSVKVGQHKPLLNEILWEDMICKALCVEVAYELNVGHASRFYSTSADRKYFDDIKWVLISCERFGELYKGLQDYIRANTSHDKAQMGEYRERLEYLNRQLAFMNEIKRKNEGNGGPITLFSAKFKNDVNYMFRNDIKLTDDEVLNRLRLYVKNKLNPDLKFKGRIAIDKYVTKDGTGYYKSTVILENGKQKLLAKSNDPDQLIQYTCINLNKMASDGNRLTNSTNDRLYTSWWKHYRNVNSREILRAMRVREEEQDRD